MEVLQNDAKFRPKANSTDVPPPLPLSTSGEVLNSKNFDFFQEDKEKVSGAQTEEVHLPQADISQGARVKSMGEYKTMYDRSLNDPEAFWSEIALKHVEWFQKFTHVTTGSLMEADHAWFLNGKLNICYNCIDRHLRVHPNKVAILWEGDNPKDVRRVTYYELHQMVCKLANALKAQGVRKGDPVCIYMPMVPEAAVAMLACTRIGAPHTVVFAGFSSDSLRDRILDADAQYVITADEGLRAGKGIPLKTTVDKALNECPRVKSVIVFKRTGGNVPMQSGRDVWWHDVVGRQRPYCPCEWMDSEDTAFLLYTSGSTGTPKGILHTTGGYLVYAAFTHAYVFDVRENDVYACVADIGWVTGHSYIVYGPLCNGTTTLMFEGTPLFPDAGRYWDMVQRHKISIFYTAPTAIRAIMKFGDALVKKHDRSSLRVLGSVGEPINPEAWRWYFSVVGEGRCAVADTYWQTESGGIMLTPLPGCTPMKPGAATFPFFGIDVVLVDDHGQVVHGNDQKGVLCIRRSWPGMARTIFNDHPRFVRTYMGTYPGLYFTGDGCTRDKDGFYWITGRVDDVVNVSGHRIGCVEIESALVSHMSVAEAAVVGIPHDIKGQCLFAYVVPKRGVEARKELVTELQMVVRTVVGAFAVPDEILVTQLLPKTRSGKIMRRILRKVAQKEAETIGDVSTLADPHVVEQLVEEVAAMRAARKELLALATKNAKPTPLVPSSPYPPVVASSVLRAAQQ